MKNRIDNKNIDYEFFALDQEKKIARIQLDYGNPDEIIDTAVNTKTPKMSDGFLGRISRSFEYVPDDYQLDIQIFFDDLDGYSEENLADICKKNVLLETKMHRRNAQRQNRLALSLCGLGLILVLASIGINLWWAGDSIAKQIVTFVLEIAATVPFWSAADIYFVQGGERRRNVANFVRRFHSITFHKKEN